jgi:membrane-bound lytic murein transglycosylase B
MLRIFSTLIGNALVLVLTAALACGCSRPPPPQAKAVAPVQPDIPGVKAYRAGVAAIAADDSEQAQRLLLDAVHQNQGLAEAWFDLGHIKVTMAPRLMKNDELQAMVLFREGLQFEQQARKLLDEGRITVWNPDEVEKAREKMEVDLRDADHALADEDSLREALRLRVY